MLILHVDILKLMTDTLTQLNNFELHWCQAQMHVNKVILILKSSLNVGYHSEVDSLNLSMLD